MPAEKKSKITELVQSGVGVGTWRVLPGQVLESIRAMKRGKAGIDGWRRAFHSREQRYLCASFSAFYCFFTARPFAHIVYEFSNCTPY